MKQVRLLDEPFKMELEISRPWLHSLPNVRLVLGKRFHFSPVIIPRSENLCAPRRFCAILLQLRGLSARSAKAGDL
jgi:hypothetical protein